MELIERVRTFEIDHAPDGWPAIQMRDISTLANELEKSERKLAVAREELLRCKQIMLHECGIGLVNEVVLARIGGDDAGT